MVIIIEFIDSFNKSNLMKIFLDSWNHYLFMRYEKKYIKNPKSKSELEIDFWFSVLIKCFEKKEEKLI
jgi:hypothetical protein